MGKLSEESFLSLTAKNRDEREQKSHRLEHLVNSLKQADSKTQDIEHWIRAVRKRFHTLNRETVEELIDHVEIGERADDGSRDIRIHYKFVVCVE